MDNNFNIDANTMNKLNDMVKNGDVSKLISQIPPDMLQNFSSLMNNNTNIKKDSTDDVKNNENNTILLTIIITILLILIILI